MLTQEYARVQQVFVDSNKDFLHEGVIAFVRNGMKLPDSSIIAKIACDLAGSESTNLSDEWIASLTHIYIALSLLYQLSLTKERM